MICLLPQRLDIDELIAIHSTNDIDRFNRDHMVYLLHLITEIPAMDRRLEIEDGFIPIHAATVQRLIKNYNQYLTYLVKAGVLESDGRYVPGQKCKGYQFVTKYLGPVRPVTLIDKRLIKKLKPQSLPVAVQRNYRHLLKWFGPELSISYDLAVDFLQRDLQRKVKYSELREHDPRTFKKKDPYEQYNHARVAVEKFRAAAFRISIDNKGFRLHSLLSNMRSELRNCLLYNGLEMVSIDICNSQPYLLLLLLRKSFWEPNPSTEGLHITQLLSNGRNGTTQPLSNINKYSSSSLFVSSYIMISEIEEMQARCGFEVYREVAGSGRFYEYMMEKMDNELGIIDLDRKQVKAMLFQVLFTSNRYIGQADAEPKRMFRALFPDVYKIMSIIKKKGKELLPILLQRIESHLVLQVITKRIAKEKPSVPLFTIHDSIATTAGNEGYVQGIMLEELGKAIGVLPRLRVERWGPANLRFGDGRPFVHGSKVLV